MPVWAFFLPFFLSQKCDIIYPYMRNIFLCLLVAMFFAPDAMAASAGRSIQKNDTNIENARASSVTRSGANRVATNTSRSENSVTRTADTPRVSSRSAENVMPRTSNVVSRVADSGRITTVKQRRQNAHMSPISDAARADEPTRTIANRAAIAAKEKKVTAADMTAAKELLEQTASLNKSCQEQYNECMDQFCAVVDTNQKRCSCSANLSKYNGVQEAVTNANNELNQVAQRIRYVGLSADEIRAIMTETEAEAELSGTKDTSETRSMLSKIEALIKDPKTSVTTTSDNEFGLDLDLDFSDDSADIFSLDFLDSNTDSISSKRGTALYNAAKKRCKVILNNCVDVGATSNQITGNYDLAIDKDCIAYEQGLKKMNETLQSNVRSAGLMLQKARLAVLQNKNQYDPKGCVSALESCMTDDMVCGSDYEKCLDPTKVYIDENGKVVLGQDITNITAFMQGFNNAAINSEKLSNASSASIDDVYCKTNNDGSCVIKYLLGKIGTGQTIKDGGLCRAVLDKCQQYTYNASGEKYNPYNDIVVNYIQRAMVNIKSAQQKTISDYASTCMTEVASCYNQQVTQVNSWSSVASVSSIKGVMTGACRNVALTCAYAIFANMCTTGGVNAMNWVLAGTCANSSDPDDVCPSYDSSTTCTPCDSDNQPACIEGISEIFYQSLLCPENSTYVPSSASSSCTTGADTNRTIAGCVNTQCRCNAGYTVWNNSCLAQCPGDAYRDDYGTCKACETTPTGNSTLTSEYSDSGCTAPSN